MMSTVLKLEALPLFLIIGFYSITETNTSAMTNVLLFRLTASLSYFAVNSFYALIVTYGILFGFGIGIAYSPSMTLAMRVSLGNLTVCRWTHIIPHR